MNVLLLAQRVLPYTLVAWYRTLAAHTMTRQMTRSELMRFPVRVILACLLLMVVMVQLYLYNKGSNLTEKEEGLVAGTLEFLYKIHQHESRVYSQNGEDGK